MHVAKNILLTLIGIICGLMVVTAQNVGVPKLREIKGKKLNEEIHPLQHKKGLWGYANSEDEYIIKPVFTEAYDFEGNLARVSVEDKWGIIGSNGLFISEPVYGYISEFSADSVAIVERGGLYGLVDNNGRILVTQRYQAIEKKNYGYLVKSANKFGTLDVLGKPLMPLQFDVVVALDDGSKIETFEKDGKWGMLKNGNEVLVHKWDKRPKPFKAGNNLEATVYLVSQEGDIGVVSSYGDNIVPCYYDNIELDSSNQYFITTKGGRYGALTLRLKQILPPIYSTKPLLSQTPFRVYDGESFYAGYVDGAVEFRYLSGLYYDLFGYDKYVETSEIPVWTKDVLIEENVSNVKTSISDSRKVIDVLTRHNFDITAAEADAELPRGIALTFPAVDKVKYGISHGCSFMATTGDDVSIRGRSYTTQYESQDGNMLFLCDAYTSEYYISVDTRIFSVKDIFTKYKIKPYNGFYPVEYLKLSNGLVAVHLAFVHSKNDGNTSLFETDPNMLASNVSNIKLYSGSSKLDNEIHVILIINTRALSSEQAIQLPKSAGYRIISTTNGAFYIVPSSSFIADAKTALKRYDKDGLLEWEFRPAEGEKFYDIEETENYIYLCGSKLDSGKETPIILQLTKGGLRKELIVESRDNTYFSNIKCSGYILYVRTSKVKSHDTENGYYPYRVLADLNDDIGINLKCEWENWGGAEIGGCGLVSIDGKWIQAPILNKDDICTSYNWEFGSFDGNILIVRHFDRYGAVNRRGNLVVDTKYDEVRELSNKNYVRVKLNGRYGVYDVEGRVIVPQDYDYVGSMNEDMIIVAKDGLYGCFDMYGNVVVPLMYDEIREFVNGIAAFRLGGSYGFISDRGEVLLEPFAEDVGSFSDGMVWAKVQGSVGFISKTGEWVVQPTYAAGGSFSCGLAPVMVKGKDACGYVDNQGVLRIPAHYDKVDPFNADFKIARVSINDKWGVIGMDGKAILPIVFSVVEIFPDGYIVVKKGDSYGIYMCDGTEVFPIECASIAYKRDAELFWYGSISARSADASAITIDRFGNIIRPFAKAIANR